MAKVSSAVISPNYGLYFDRPALDVSLLALTAGMNFRVINKRLNNFNLGRKKFSTWTLGAPVLGIDNFFPRGIDEHLMFLTGTDIYRYDATNDVPVLLTPRYETGTIAVTNGSKIVTGTGTTFTGNVKAGDMLYVGGAGQTAYNAAWVKIASVDSATQVTLETNYAGATASGQAYTIRKLFTAAVDGFWDFDTFVNDGDSGEDQWIATNGVDNIVSWNGTDTQVTLHPELGFICDTVATYRNMMIYGTITEIASGTYYPTSIINSEAGFPFHAGDNVTDPLSISAQFQVHSGTDKIINLIPLGDNLVIYASAHAVLGQFVGGDTIFIFRQAVSDLGPIARNAIADFGTFHEFIGPDTQYSFDGVSAQPMSNHVMRSILLTLDPPRKGVAFAHFDDSNGDLIWSFPLTTDSGAGTVGSPPEVAYAEHYLEDVPNGTPIPFSARSFKYTATGFYEKSEGTTWNDAAQSWADTNFAWNDQFASLNAPLNIGGDENGQIWIFGQSQKDDGVGLASYVHFGRRPTGTGRERNMVKRIYPFATQIAGQTLDVNTYFSDHGAGVAMLKSTEVFDENLVEGGHFVSVFHRGRYFEVEFASPTGTAWEISGYDCDIVQGGMR